MLAFNSDGDMVDSNGEYVDDIWSVSASDAQSDRLRRKFG